MIRIITDTCIENICAKLNIHRKDIATIRIGGTMFIIELYSGAIATIDYKFLD